jgi:hypothetical protein
MDVGGWKGVHEIEGHSWSGNIFLGRWTIVETDILSSCQSRFQSLLTQLKILLYNISNLS